MSSAFCCVMPPENRDDRTAGLETGAHVVYPSALADIDRDCARLGLARSEWIRRACAIVCESRTAQTKGKQHDDG
jgi:hypothetical protein